MASEFHASAQASIESAEKTLGAALYALDQADRKGPGAIAVQPFVTVSRQPGAGALTLSHRLADRLNGNGPVQWSAWDKELVEKVSAEHGIDQDLVQQISDRSRNWLSDVFSGFSVHHAPYDVAEAKAYRRVITTIRALATAGKAIIVGRGGVYITQGMPGGIHLRVVAPLAHRLAVIAERDGVSPAEAVARSAQAEQNQQKFYEHYWPGRRLEPENFTMTLNSAELSIDEMVECVLPMIRLR